MIHLRIIQLIFILILNVTYIFCQNSEESGGGEYIHKSISNCISEDDYARISHMLQENMTVLQNKGLLQKADKNQLISFTFPLKTTKGIITSGNEVGAKWCYEAQSNCHHDYNAADIMVPAGTIVIAAKEGEVIKASNSSGPCGSSVQIKDSGGQVYYYTHMANGSVTVTKGQQVSAGTVLGSVSANQHCNSSPHLHFDMPAPPLSYRPSCSGAGCNAYSFLEVQPVLTASYAALQE